MNGTDVTGGRRPRALPEELQGLLVELNRLRRDAMVDGKLDRKTKELAALGMAVMTRSNAGTATHLHNAMEAGASHGEIAEMIGVAMAMAGEAVALHGLQALKALTTDEDEDFLPPRRPYMTPD